MTLEAMLRDQIALVEQHTWRGARRIRITEMTPPGTILLAPFEEDGSIPSPDRRTDDGGSQEALMHPDDWAAIVKRYTNRDWRGVMVGTYYAGIPVVDDTIEARMKREGTA